VPAAIALGVLYTVPAVQVVRGGAWLEGVALAVLLCVFLRLERVERHGALTALALVGAAGIVALFMAPRLDVDRPILDYEAIARSFGPDRGLAFSWSHDYGPLRWPRTGREVLRVRSKSANYWKTENLSRFDGTRWTQSHAGGPTAREAVAGGRARPQWQSEIHVRVRAMLTRQFVGAGTMLGISASPRIPIRSSPGTFRTGPRPLRQGHSYDATVWTPRPSRRELRGARSAAPAWTWQYLRTEIPLTQRRQDFRVENGSTMRAAPRTAQVSFPAYGTGERPTLNSVAPGEPVRPAQAVVSESPYGGVLRLARRLRKGTDTPYEYVRRVQAHLAEGYTYNEAPPASRAPLVNFLLRDKQGYCQQFSGGMALLLRMGGVPARVATGFSPGTLDRDAREWVVHDTDAHSWVEAYIAPFGWVTFDPTPPIGPARLDLGAGAAASAYALGLPQAAIGAGERVGDRSVDTGPAHAGPPRALIAAGVLVVLLLLAGGLLLWRLRRLRDRRPPVDVALEELRGALARTGRAASPDVTLQVMLRRFRNTPAEPYLRVLQQARYGGADVAPTPAMRAALRKELTLGLGPAARLGAWRAIPPMAPRPSRPRTAYPDEL
jgi:transglutaminase-like putative cysteine protease